MATKDHTSINCTDVGDPLKKGEVEIPLIDLNLSLLCLIQPSIWIYSVICCVPICSLSSLLMLMKLLAIIVKLFIITSLSIATSCRSFMYKDNSIFYLYISKFKSYKFICKNQFMILICFVVIQFYISTWWFGHYNTFLVN